MKLSNISLTLSTSVTELNDVNVSEEIILNNIHRVSALQANNVLITQEIESELIWYLQEKK